ncbi:MAG: Flp pilus assembly protein CpaB [Planctomycetaceae bacterium]|nr:Flp pilus assembly protein CpaB [Planctomycetaceae bacterium]
MLTTEKLASGDQGRSTGRNSRATVLVSVVAVLCGLLGVGLKMSQTKPKPAPPLISVPVAVRDLEAGRVVQSSDFYLRRCTREQIQELPVRDFYSQGKEIVGRIVQSKVAKGAPFGLDSLYAEGTGPSPADDLGPGFRGVTVGVKLVGGVRGFASPNAWVDVLFRRDDVTRPRSFDEARTHTLFHTVRVLAVGGLVYPDSQLPRDVRGNVSDQFEITLALTPEQTEIIKTLEGRGTLSLSLLPPQPGREPLGDLPSSGVLDVLLGVVEPEVTPPAPPIAERVELYRGGQSNVVELLPGESIAPATEDRGPRMPPRGDVQRHVPAPNYPTAPVYYYHAPVGSPMGASVQRESRQPEIIFVRVDPNWRRPRPTYVQTQVAAPAPPMTLASSLFHTRR